MDSHRSQHGGGNDDTDDFARREDRGSTPEPEDRSSEYDERVQASPENYIVPFTAVPRSDQLSYTEILACDNAAVANDHQEQTSTRGDQEASTTTPNPSSGRRRRAPPHSDDNITGLMGLGRLQERDAELGWYNSFSPSARRHRDNLSGSSQQAVRDPAAVVQSVGTQRLMPSRDPMAAFDTAPRPKGEN